MDLQQQSYTFVNRVGKVEIEYPPFVNYVLTINGVPTFERFVITNDGDTDWHNVTVRLSGDMYVEAVAHIDIAARQSIDIVDKISLAPDPHKLASLTESEDTTFALKIEIDGALALERECKITLQAYDQWLGSAIRPDLLAAFVTPNHPLIARVIGAARPILKRLTGSDSFDAYQTGDPNRVRCQVAAIYEALRGEGLTYITPPASFGLLGQRVRLVDKVLEEKLGTCLDLTLLYASCLEAIGLNPLLVLKAGHCFAGCWLVRDAYPQSVGDDANFLLKAISDGISEIVVMEATCITSTDKASFEDSCSMAQTHLNKESEFECFIDVCRARINNVRPMPLRLRQTDGSWQIVNEGADHDVSAGKVKALDRYDLSVYDNSNAEVTKYTIWERKLLDFSLRNTLLNVRAGRRIIPLLSFAIDRLEDFLQDGKSFNVRPFPLDTPPVPGERGIFESSSYPNVEEYVVEELKQKHLYSFLREDDLDNSLKYVYRASRTSLEENGSNNLYLVLGLLKWYEAELSQDPHFAPVLLLPIEILRALGGGGYTIRARDEEVALNITLVELLRQQHDIDLSVLAELPKDEYGVDVKKILAIVRDKIRNKKGWNVLDESLIGIFSFNKFVMWNDIHSNSEVLHQHPIISSLVEGTLKVDGDGLADIDVRGFDHDRKPAEYAIPIDVDSSQLEAIIASGMGKSFILHGPPGTGKSQTITNIIANALYQGKRVLFVAEKMAALEVVQARLAKIGLEPFCLELHSNKATKQHFLHQMEEALNVVRGADTPEYAELSDRVFAERQEILKHVEAMHQPDASGFRLYDCIERYFAVADCADPVALSQAAMAAFTPERMEQAIDMVRRMEPVLKIVGSPDKHPLAGLLIGRDHEEAERQLRQHVPEAAKLVPQFQELARQFEHTWGVDIPDFDWSAQELEALNELLKSPFASSALVDLVSEPEKIASLLAAVAAVEDAMSKRGAIAATYSDAYVGLDHLALRSQWRDAEAKWFLPRYFARKKLMGQLPPSRTLVNVADIPAIADQIERANAAYAAYKPYEPELAAIFGSAVASGLKWPQIHAALDAADRLAKLKAAGAGRPTVIFRHGALGRLSKALGLLDKETLADAIALNDRLIDINKQINSHYQQYSPFLTSHEGNLCELTLKWNQHLPMLKDWVLYCKHLTDLSAFVGLADWHQLSHADGAAYAAAALQKGFFMAKIRAMIEANPALNYFNGILMDDIVKRYREITKRLQEVSKRAVYNKLASNLPSMTMLAHDTSELGILKRNIKSGGRGKSIRSIIDMVPTLLPKLCPCMLMSPISVAQYISLDAPKFDLVIFDEASQMPTSEAVGAIARGKGLIVVGDPKQMPPTSFFSTSAVGEDEAYIDDMESILDDCAAMSVPSKYLTWHYRSKHESLITFSNLHYYDGRLTTFPSVDNLTSKVTMRMINGVYDRSRSRSNLAEAQAVVDEVMRRLQDKALSRRSIGIVAFSKVQQDKIEDMLNAELAKHPDLEALAFKSAEPIFVKNLENVQGDERDVILFSIGYGPDKTGKVSMNFGPLNNAGGERRLNVAVSRARYEMIVFSSLLPEQIDLRRTNSLGVAGLKHFLEYASRGTQAARAGAPMPDQDHVLQRLQQLVREAGYDYDVNVGSSSFKVDIAIKDPDDPGRYLLGILVDGPAYYAVPTTRDREIVQPSVLRLLNWNVMKVWAVDLVDRSAEFVNALKAKMDEVIEAKRNAPAEADVPEAIIEEEPEPIAVMAQPQELCVNNQCVEYPAVDSGQKAALENADQLYLCKPRLRDYLLDVIEAEAPITNTLLYKRVVKAFGLNRVSPKVVAAVNDVLSTLRMHAQPNGGESTVYWRAKADAQDYDKYRINSGRDISDVPLIEVENAMLYVLQQQIALDADDLKRLTANQLGFTRKGANIEVVTTAVLDKLHAAGRLKIDGTKVMQP